jgi:membrane protein DedA with SNARE-associated domain
MITTAIGAGLWNTLLIFIGSKLGERWADLDGILKPYLTPLKYMVVIVVVGFCIYQGRKVYMAYKASKK